MSPSLAPTRAMRAWATGRVQGVGFREAARREAERLGLSGWARNLPDGRVELFAEGPAEALDRLEVWLWIGPPRAEVERVERLPAVPRGEAGFMVRRGGRG